MPRMSLRWVSLPKFSHFYTRQMNAEQLFQSLAVATQANRKGNLEEQQKKREDWMRQFVVAFGTDEGDETTTFNGSIPQSLMLFNGDLIREAISTEPGSWLHSMSQNKGPIADKVQYSVHRGSWSEGETRRSKCRTAIASG